MNKEYSWYIQEAKQATQDWKDNNNMKVPANKIEEIETQTAWIVWMAVLIVPAIVVLIDWLLY